MIDFGIIAAGDGNRIKEEGSILPKPLIEIEGKPMIGRLISLMEGCGANSVSIIVNSDMPDVLEYLRDIVPSTKCELKVASKKTPSSMHTFFELLNLMKPEDKFIVTTVDTIFRRNEFNKYVDFFKNSPEDVDGVMGVTTFIDDEKPLYVETNLTGHITGYKDSRDDVTMFDKTSPLYISAGVYGLRTSGIGILQKCIDGVVTRMRNFQRELVADGLNLLAYDLGKVLDVDHLSDIEKANQFLHSTDK